MSRKRKKIAKIFAKYTVKKKAKSDRQNKAYFCKQLDYPMFISIDL